MIVVVTGSRNWRNIQLIEEELLSLLDEPTDDYFADVTLRQGCASGADCIARWVGVCHGFIIEDFWPDFTSPFAEAMKERNIQMLDTQPTPDLVLAFPTKDSRGTWHCVNEAKKRNIPVRIFNENA